MKYKKVKLEHGFGGRLTHEFMKDIFLPVLGNSILNNSYDSATVNVSGRVAFSTDSCTANPLYFCGGNIGRLSIARTINRIATKGAVARYVSAAFVFEEGFLIEDLKNILLGMKHAADEANVYIVTSDLKVVAHSDIDGIMITTTALGDFLPGINLSTPKIIPGMDLILSGYVGDHELAVLMQQNGLDISLKTKSDCAPLAGFMQAVMEAVPTVALLKTANRGGLATALNEIAGETGHSILVNKEEIPIRKNVREFSFKTGRNPLTMENEGKMLAVVPSQDTDRVLSVMKNHCYGKNACIIGKVMDDKHSKVWILDGKGELKVVNMHS